MSGCKKRFANHLVIENKHTYKISDIQKLDMEIECENWNHLGLRHLPFALIDYRYMNDIIIPFEFLPFVDISIIMEKRDSEITC